MPRYLFDVDPSFYDDSGTDFYQDEPDDHDQAVQHWKKVSKHLTPAQITLTVGDNHADDNPLATALRPVMDRSFDRARLKDDKLERMQAWASCTEGQLRAMVKRRSKPSHKGALDYIANPEEFIKEVLEFKATHPTRKRWQPKVIDGVETRPLYPPVEGTVVAASATSWRENGWEEKK